MPCASADHQSNWQLLLSTSEYNTLHLINIQKRNHLKILRIDCVILVAIHENQRRLII